jgi:hypothetical protein
LFTKKESAMSTRKRNRNVWQGIALAATLLVTTLSQAAGLLQPSDGSLPPLEIKAHQVEVVIEDGYAITTVEQLFHNPHNRDLAARYSFPVPEHGSVAEFTLWIDGKPVTGEVLERQQARQDRSVPPSSNPLSLRETTPWMEGVGRRRTPKPRVRVRGSKRQGE